MSTRDARLPDDDGAAAWPTSAQYSEAVQNLAFSMTDPELRGGQVTRNALELPVLYSGGFADVYQVFCPATDRTWAVKFFTRGPASLRSRYRAISETLATARLPFMTEFKYLPEGARIDGRLYPIVKMRWIEGLSLNRFVEQSLDQPRMLHKLLNLWARLAARLDQAGIAHADLQHGNVLLVPRGDDGTLQLRLIDYDGMFVPSLAGRPAAEVGLAAYQHPRRKRDNTFDLSVDRFSHLAICCAVRCLMEGGRKLWERYDMGENLLFRESDYESPGASPLFRDLWMLRQPDARALVGHLALATQRPLAQTSLVSEIMKEGGVTQLTPAEQREVDALFRSGRSTGGAKPTAVPPNDPAADGGSHSPAPVAAPEIVDAELVVESAPPSLPRLIVGALRDGVRASVRNVDRWLGIAAGEGNALLHNFFRVILATALTLGVPALVVWTAGALSDFWRTQWERQVTAVRVEHERREAGEAEQLAEGARRSAEGAFQTALRPARLRTAQSKLEQGRAAREDEDFPEATRLFRQATDEFSTARRDAERYNALGEIDGQFETRHAGIGEQFLEQRALELLLTARGKRARARQALDANDFDGAESSYHAALADLLKASEEAERAQIVRIVGPRGELFEAALRGQDVPAAELLWNEFKAIVVSDSDRVVWERQRDRWRVAYEALPSGDDLVRSLGMKLTRIRAGEFLMGSANGPSNEQPSHRVRITRDFYLGRYEVTQAEYELVMGVNPSRFVGKTLPVEQVTAVEADDYCRRLTARERSAGRLPTGLAFRLPTEAEWEYAARAGTNNTWSGTDDQQLFAADAWFGDNSSQHTHPGGGKRPNAWGLYDMLGNVAEWVADDYDPDAYGTRRDAVTVDPIVPATPSRMRSRRGGSWQYVASDCRPGVRNGSLATKAFETVGFRVALDIDVPVVPNVKRPTFAETADIVEASCGIRLKRVSAGKLPVEEFIAKTTPSDSAMPHEWVTRDFHLGRHEVTEKQFRDVMGEEPVTKLGDDYPVDQVTAQQAEEFCRRLTERDRASRTIPATKEYRLPTEVQWEYAARAGTTSRWFHGDDAGSLARYAWHVGNSTGQRQPVGSREANPWGFHDLLGNVAEWTATPGRIRSVGLAPGVEPAAPGLPVGYVMSWVWRGGRYLDGEEGCRVDLRSGPSSGQGSSGVGFRVALVDADEPTYHLSSFELANGLKLVRIRPGEFHMGTSEGGYSDETPAHDVRISRYFYLGETEVTQAQYQAIRGFNPSARRGDDLPVENVTWFDALDFVERLNQREGNAGRLPIGMVFSLPTEAQWEYAARAGWRSSPWVERSVPITLTGYAWFDQISSDELHPVRQLAPNRWGLFDVAGNVSEWVLDAADRQAYQRPGGAGAIDPYIDPATVVGPNSESRVHRGGCFRNVASDVRLARRYFADSSEKIGTIGFRIALVEIAGDPRRNGR